MAKCFESAGGEREEWFEGNRPGSLYRRRLPVYTNSAVCVWCVVRGVGKEARLPRCHRWKWRFLCLPPKRPRLHPIASSFVYCTVTVKKTDVGQAFNWYSTATATSMTHRENRHRGRQLGRTDCQVRTVQQCCTAQYSYCTLCATLSQASMTDDQGLYWQGIFSSPPRADGAQLHKYRRRTT